MPQLKAIYTVFRSYHRGGIVAECGAVCRGAVLGKFGFGIVVKVKREDLYRLFAVTEPGKRAYEIGVRRRDGFGKVKTAVGGEPALYGFSGVDFSGICPLSRVLMYFIIMVPFYFVTVPYPMFLTANSYALRQNIRSI